MHDFHCMQTKGFLDELLRAPAPALCIKKVSEESELAKLRYEAPVALRVREG